MFLKKLFSSFDKRQKENYDVGYSFYLEINIDEVLNCNGTLNVFLEKLASILNCKVAQICYNPDGTIHFEAYNSNETKIIHIVDNNEHMEDFIIDIYKGRKSITPFTIQLEIMKKVSK